MSENKENKPTVEYVDNPKVISNVTDVKVVDTREIQDQVKNETRQKEESRIKEIMSIATKFKMVDEGLKSVNDGTTLDDFRAIALKKFEDVKHIDTGEANLDLTKKEIKEYSFGKIIQAALEGKPEIAAYEREISNTCEKRMNRKPDGIFIPHEIMLAKTLDLGLHRRELLTTGDAIGLIGTKHMPENFIELLRNNMVVASLGPLTLTGLIESVQIPKQTAAATGAWENPESTAITPVNSVYGTITLAPKIYKASTEYSNKTLKQSLPSIEALVLNDLTEVIARAIDLAALDGSGTLGVPEGIINTTGVGNITGTTLAWSHIVDAQTTVMSANALFTNAAYVTDPTTMGLMKQRERFATTGLTLWEDNNSVNGFPGVTTTQMPAATIIFGSWNQLVMGFWGALELLIDPFSLSLQLATRIVGAQAVDVAVRHPESFVVIDTIT